MFKSKRNKRIRIQKQRHIHESRFIEIFKLPKQSDIEYANCIAEGIFTLEGVFLHGYMKYIAIVRYFMSSPSCQSAWRAKAFSSRQFNV